MMAATFAARANLDAAALDADEATEQDVLPAMRVLRRLVTVIARCADDLVPYGDIDMIISQANLDVWARAAINVRDALRGGSPSRARDPCVVWQGGWDDG